MGRRKITIKQITDPKLRHITFNKRKNGLIKKAAELSMLCNVNMLLVFEDGAGNLVQFSKNKINSINNFFQECKYHNIVELTAKEYPNFFKVNHYKKTKNRLQEGNTQDEDDDDDDDSELNNAEIYDFNQSEAKDELSKATTDLKQKDFNVAKKLNQQNFNPFLPQHTKTESFKPQEIERPTLVSDNRPSQEVSGVVSKKAKGKANGQNASQADATKSQRIPNNNDMPGKNLSMGGEMNEALFNSANPYRKDNFQEDQSKSIDNKGMDYNPAAFMPPNMDPIKRLSSVPDPINSSFQFYQTNNRLRPFNNFGLPFGNEEAFNSMLKNYSFQFPIPANVPFLSKPSNNGEMDDKILDTAKVLNYLNQTGSTPLNRQNIFTFPQADYSKMPTNESMRQAGGVNAPEYHNPYMEEAHDELPAIFKGDPRFDAALPSGNLNNRRYGNFDGFFNGFEEDYGGEKTKKFKHN